MLRKITFLLVAALTAFFVFALDRKDFFLPGTPPVGQFLSPFYGFWQNCDPQDPTDVDEQTFAELKGEARVQFDERMVPHIFATNEHDLYFLQGYITARMRLWQMETQVRAAGGRLAEVLGEGLVPLDKFHRRIGMRSAAEAALEVMMADTTTKVLLEAYTQGVNAYIESLSPADYPLEYKLLDYAPESWEPIKCALLLKYMAWDLTGRTQDQELTRVFSRYGRGVADDLFPNVPLLSEPIIPPGTPWDFKPLSIPKPPLHLLVADSSFMAVGFDPLLNRPNAGNGSNNWAVGAEKSASGFPILANDPHLSLTLPSLWFEVQLVGPDVNVYGVSLPGAPGVIIGYNERISWGVTNHGADVLDWYRIRYADADRTQYVYGSDVRPIHAVVETLMVRGGETIYDTVRYSHHGPIVYDNMQEGDRASVPSGHALRWMAHEASNELLAFYHINRAHNYSQFLKSFDTYVCPAQNFAYSDNQKNIAMVCAGKIPLRWPAQGRFLLDGADPAADWQGYLPIEHLPRVKNPKRGYVSSANQVPADSTYPYPYLGFFASFERGLRINRSLDSMQNASVDSLRFIQLDEQNLLAKAALPALLRQTRKRRLDGQQIEWLAALEQWDQQNNANSTTATYFHLWWYFLSEAIWADDFPEPDYPQPDAVRTAMLIRQDTASRWYDNRKTEVREKLPDLLSEALVAARDSLKRFSTDKAQWAWGRYKGSHIPHLTRSASLKSLGRHDLNLGGGRDEVNAMDVTHGPSWRMVVSMGPYVKGYGIYPGGQSGHAGSRWYDNFVDTWAAGRLDELLYLKQPAEGRPRYLVGELLAHPDN